MKTLIELYDERPIENVLGSEVFRPDYTVFLCQSDIARNEKKQKQLREYFARRGMKNQLVFLESERYNSDSIREQLAFVVAAYPDCVMDITGGTDAALFACGQLSAQMDIPAFTYSRKMNRFYNIHRAPFADNLECTLKHKVEDCFEMAGGAMREGRVDNNILAGYMKVIDPFFRVYLKYRTDWTRTVSYLQRVSPGEKGKKAALKVNAPRNVKGEHGGRLEAPEEVLKALAGLGFLRNLSFEGDMVSFIFKNEQVRTWLRDVGSVLELYSYKACLDSGLFQEVRTSVVVDWEGDFRHDNVTNEIDVMAMQGVLPVFISCKTCDISTEALNELAILRDRFGGKMAKAVIISAQHCRNITRHRASELDIEVIDLEDLRKRRLVPMLKSMMKREL